MDILALHYGKMLVLGAISAASAFVVTILIVLVCVGCHMKSKSKHSHAGVGSQKRNMDLLRQSKLSSMSKSDTRLHEIHRLPYSENGAPKDRPASMDLLFLQSHRLTSDLYPPPFSSQLPCIPTGTESEKRDHQDHQHDYQEDEGLYERVGEWRAPPAPLVNSVQRQAITENRQGAGGGGGVQSRGLNEAGQAEMMVEYASVKKVRKLERGRSQEGPKEENASNSTVHRKTMEPFPKIFETYSTICKPLKKEHLGSTQQINGQIGSGEKDSMGPESLPSGENCYEAVGEKAWSKVFDSDPTYATINPMQKREMLCSQKQEESSCEPLPGPERTMTCENFYESIEDMKQGTKTTSTTTIFTFNDGMEMYITGL